VPRVSSVCHGLRSWAIVEDCLSQRATFDSLPLCCSRRYLRPPWVACELESKELLALCLKKITGLNKCRVVDAGFVWTEPHSRRIKVKLTIQKEIESGAKLQQSFIVEFTLQNQQCDVCQRSYTNNTWGTCVQLRQKVPLGSRAPRRGFGVEPSVPNRLPACRAPACPAICCAASSSPYRVISFRYCVCIWYACGRWTTRRRSSTWSRSS
jgi:hypothetical protein